MRLASHLIATLLLLATKALAESADGNYIFCVSDASEPRGFTFRDGIVAESFHKGAGRYGDDRNSLAGEKSLTTIGQKNYIGIL